jgi:uncharacterized protein (TIGR02147 family)
MEVSVFDFRSYKAYLRALAGPDSQRRGFKSAVAKALRCHPTFISQVFRGSLHLSLEQADALTQFLGHGKEEASYFLLLVQWERAGTPTLRLHFEEQIESVLRKRMVLTERLGKQNELSNEDRGVYYSSWHYTAIHVAISITELNRPKALADFFKLSLKKVNEVLGFLTRTGLALEEQGRYKCGVTLIRLGNDSPLIFRHHSNWRMLAMEALDREEIGDLHYSGVVSLSKADALKIKDRLLERLKEDIALIRKSTDEEVYCYCLDFFTLRR